MAQATNRVARYLTIAVTQGSADAFVQGSVDTGIIPDQGLALEVVGFEVVLTPIEAVSADWNIVWSISRDTKTAVGYFTDPEIILSDGMAGSLTTSGAYWIPLSRRYDAPEGIFLVEPTLYFQLDSNATGLTLAAQMRCYYREIRLSEIDILRVLNNS